MKTTRLPPRWLALHEGDMIVSKVPLHRMEKYADAAKDRGFEYRFDPCEDGYLVICTRSPHDREAA